MMLLATIPVAAACSGPSSSVPDGFSREGCQAGASLRGATGMGISHTGFTTDVDAQIAVVGSTDGHCVRAESGDEE